MLLAIGWQDQPSVGRSKNSRLVTVQAPTSTGSPLITPRFAKHTLRGKQLQEGYSLSFKMQHGSFWVSCQSRAGKSE